MPEITKTTTEVVEVEEVTAVTCENCGVEIDESETYTAPNGEIMCEDCYNENVITCEDCGEEIMQDDAEYWDGSYYCTDCLDNITTICAGCGERISNDDRVYDEERGEDYCESCYSSLTHNHLFSYHSNEGRADERNGSRYGIGLEVEKEDEGVHDNIDADYILRNTGWAVEEDGSLNDDTGFEAISPILDPMNREHVTRSLQSVSELINAETSSHTGGHIHVSDRKLAPWELLAMTFKGYLPLFYAMYPNRLDNQYCECMRLEQYIRNQSHYNAFSVHDNTLEVRIFPSPKNIKMLEWRIELLRIILKHPRRSYTSVLSDMLSETTDLYKHLSIVYTQGDLLKKAQMFIRYAEQFEYESVDNKKVVAFSNKIGNLKGEDRDV